MVISIPLQKPSEVGGEGGTDRAYQLAMATMPLMWSLLVVHCDVIICRHATGRNALSAKQSCKHCGPTDIKGSYGRGLRDRSW